MNVIKLDQNNFFTAFEEVCSKYHTKPVFGIKKINPSEFRIECFIQADFYNFEEELASQKFWPDAKFSIGDIVPPDELMRTLTDRKIAEQERMTYSIQMEAQKTRQQLEQETAKANTQASVVTAERSVEIAEYNAKASVKSSEGEAKAKTIQAEADAKVKTVQAEADAIVFRTVGEAEAAKIQAIGSAEADVTKRKIESMGDDNFAMIQVAKYLAENKVQLVPQIMVGGSGNGANGNGITDVLLANMLQKDIDKKTK